MESAAKRHRFASSAAASWVAALREAAANETLTAKDLRDAGVLLPDDVPDDATYRGGLVDVGDLAVDPAGVATVQVRLDGGAWWPRAIALTASRDE